LGDVPPFAALSSASVIVNRYSTASFVDQVPSVGFPAP
jgi:hypothetical protein